MDAEATIAARLRRQRLTGPDRFATVADAVRTLGAVQAQEWHEVRWSVAQRLVTPDAGALDRAIADGTVVRTHVLRPTWHLVTREDLPAWMCLTRDRVRRGVGSHMRALGIDEPMAATFAVRLEGLLGDGVPRTRKQIGEALGESGVKLGHLLFLAELDLVVVSGPRAGAHHTYRLWDGPRERPGADPGDLVRRFAGSHGPAQVADAIWWSGLAPAEVRAAWTDDVPHDGGGEDRALLLGVYDEAHVGFHGLRGIRRRKAHVDLFHRPLLIGTHTVGTWRRTKQGPEVELDRRLKRAERELLDAEIDRFETAHAAA